MLISETSTEKPLKTYIYILLIVECLTIPICVYNFFTEPLSRSEQMKKIIVNTDYVASM